MKSKEKIFTILSLILISTINFSCAKSPNKVMSTEIRENFVPNFNMDSAWHYVEAQTLFGPRVPNTDAHKKCKDYLAAEMKRFGAGVVIQNAQLKAFDGTILDSYNIISSFYPERTNRILLCAHWDSRPWSDQDPDDRNWKKPVLGANDGASGVGVLMELARVIGLDINKGISKLNYGIDIIFFDSEDYGTPEFYKGEKKQDTWCLGSQYWANNKHTENYQAKYGILLDMVGDPAAYFAWEYFSMQYAQSVLNKVWSKAESLGFGKYFKSERGGAVDDDHLYINKIAKIPCIDIIDYNVNSGTGFVPYWHTQSDDMSNIDRNTLNAVGKTLLHVLYE